MTQPYYTDKNIGFFRTDQNGTGTFVTDNMENMIGITREFNLQSIAWVAHLAKDSFGQYEAWVNHAQLQEATVKKMHFRWRKPDGRLVDRYLVVESHPKYNEFGYYLGLHGIMLSLPRTVWVAFNDTEYSRSKSAKKSVDVLAPNAE